MLSNFHRTTSEHCQRTLSPQKSSPFSLKGGRTKYKRQKERQKRERDPSWGGNCEGKRSFQTPGNLLIGGAVGSFGISKDNITRRKFPQNTHLTATPRREVVQTLTSTTSKWELNREAWVACLV